MTGLDAPRGCDLYRSGPWLLVHGAGVQSEATRAAVAEQCSARQVEWESQAIDCVGAVDLAYFTALVISLPDGPGDDFLTTVLEPFANLIDCYRARRPHPLREAQIGRRRWFQVGAVHLIGYNAILQSPQLRRARARSCVTYRVDDQQVDVFAAYSRGIPPTRQSVDPVAIGSDIASEACRAAAIRLLEWGITVDDAYPLLKRLDQCRQSYEDPHQPAMYRPLPGVAKNRLDIILDGPDPIFNRAAHAKSWQENSARVWREVEVKLSSAVPDFHYPRMGRRGAVKALRALYLDLQVVADEPASPYDTMNESSTIHDHSSMPMQDPLTEQGSEEY